MYLTKFLSIVFNNISKYVNVKLENAKYETFNNIYFKYGLNLDESIVMSRLSTHFTMLLSRPFVLGVGAGLWRQWRCHLESFGNDAIEEEPHVDDEIQLIRTFAKSESATDFKGFEALHISVLDIDNQLLCSNVQTYDEQMHDELWQSFELFQRNVNKLTSNVKHKDFMHSWQMTLHDMLKQ